MVPMVAMAVPGAALREAVTHHARADRGEGATEAEALTEETEEGD
jgi:hypothetical protein